MDYEKAFKDALKAVKELQEANPSDDGIQNWVNDNFPELRESESERIKNTLIRFHKSTIDIDGIKGDEIVSWLEKQGQVKESEIPQPIKETSKENDNSLTIQNGIILDGVVYELTTGFPDNNLSLCGNCELREKCIGLGDSLCYFFADNYRKVFRKMERKS